MKILVVEDSATLRASMGKLIQEIGHTPLFAKSGEEALQLLGDSEFDLVIMDIELPGLDGFETTTILREALGEHWVPIIFATSHASDENVLAAIKAGGDDYLVKPVSRNLLEAKLIALHRIAEMQNQLNQLNSRLEMLSQKDSLTQLLNRRTFSEKAEQSLVETKRHGKSSSLMMLDVDYFKPYNDYYGHMAGDECLKEIAHCIKQAVLREGDLIGRYGGEEFIILLPDTDEAGANIVANKLVGAIQHAQIPHQKSPISDYITISIGIEHSKPMQRLPLDELIKNADSHLYQAKEFGRNQIVAPISSNKTILLADCNEAALLQLTRTLQTLGNIITTDNKTECIELAKDISPDLIILNHESKKVAAQEISDTLQEFVRTARIPIILFSIELPNNHAQHHLRFDDIVSTAVHPMIKKLLA